MLLYLYTCGVHCGCLNMVDNYCGQIGYISICAHYKYIYRYTKTYKCCFEWEMAQRSVKALEASLKVI